MVIKAAVGSVPVQLFYDTFAPALSACPAGEIFVLYNANKQYLDM